MTLATPPVSASPARATDETPPTSPSRWQRALRSGRVVFGGGIVLLILLLSFASLPWTLSPESSFYYAKQFPEAVRQAPMLEGGVLNWFGYDVLGRSIFARCLQGGAISLLVGLAAAAISVVLGVSVGLLAGYRGGWIDAVLMRIVDVLYGLPYILLVILFKIALEPPITRLLSGIAGPSHERRFDPAQAANLIVLFSAIGLVSWLTMARVVRGQVLSIRAQPYIEACRAIGLPAWRILLRHVLPNLVGPVIVYATLTVPQAILQESFLSFLGVGVNPPLPTWGSLASEGIASLSPVRIYWWMLLFPCLLLVITLLSLNYLGDGLRDVFDPRGDEAKL